jgi:lysozyme family protein
MSDGVLGPITLAAAKQAKSPSSIIAYQAARLRFMTSLPTWNKFSGGWSKRLFSVFGDALRASD